MPIRTNTQPSTAENGRFSREEWLIRALDVLARKGASHLRIVDIAGELGVSKGSFYHHFASLAEFRSAVVEYWDDVFNRRVGRELMDGSGSPEDKLWQLMQSIVAHDLGLYDVAIRAWAERDPDVRALVEQADLYRLKNVRSLFEEMGFSGMELEARARTFVFANSAENAVYLQLPDAKRLKVLRAQHKFFVSRG